MTFRRLTLGAILAAAMLTVLAPPSGAITAGQLDGNGHPDVAIIYFYQPDGRFRCSATQVSDTCSSRPPTARTACAARCS